MYFIEAWSQFPHASAYGRIFTRGAVASCPTDPHLFTVIIQLILPDSTRPFCPTHLHFSASGGGGGGGGGCSPQPPASYADVLMHQIRATWIDWTKYFFVILYLTLSLKEILKISSNHLESIQLNFKEVHRELEHYLLVWCHREWPRLNTTVTFCVDEDLTITSCRNKLWMWFRHQFVYVTVPYKYKNKIPREYSFLRQSRQGFAVGAKHKAGE